MAHERDENLSYETLHRLRTPLTVALLAASRLRRMVPMPERAAQWCDYLLTALKEMRDELNDIERRIILDEQRRHDPQVILSGDEPAAPDAPR